MARYTAEYSRKGHYGTSICTANTIEQLIQKLVDNGYTLHSAENDRVLHWNNTDKKKYYGAGLTIRKGELEMTDYTSF